MPSTSLASSRAHPSVVKGSVVFPTPFGDVSTVLESSGTDSALSRDASEVFFRPQADFSLSGRADRDKGGRPLRSLDEMLLRGPWAPLPPRASSPFAESMPPLLWNAHSVPAAPRGGLSVSTGAPHGGTPLVQRTPWCQPATLAAAPGPNSGSVPAQPPPPPPTLPPPPPGFDDTSSSDSFWESGSTESPPTSRVLPPQVLGDARLAKSTRPAITSSAARDSEFVWGACVVRFRFGANELKSDKLLSTDSLKLKDYPGFKGESKNNLADLATLLQRLEDEVERGSWSEAALFKILRANLAGAAYTLAKEGRTWREALTVLFQAFATEAAVAAFDHDMRSIRMRGGENPRVLLSRGAAVRPVRHQGVGC